MKMTNISKVARLILNIALNNKDLNQNSILLNHGLLDILSLRAKIDDNIDNDDSDTIKYSTNKNIQAEIDSIMQRCSAHLIDEILHRAGEEKLFSIFSIIDWASTKKQFSDNVVIPLLNKHLNLNIRSNRKLRETKLYLECESKIDSLLNIIKYEVKTMKS